MSSCIVQADSEELAKNKLVRALRGEAIELAQILDGFEMDPDDDTIRSWTQDGYRSRCEQVHFDVWHTFQWS